MTDILLNVAEIKILYSTKVKAKDRIKISSSKDINNLFKAFFEKNCQIEHREYMYLCLLNRYNNVLGISHISTGGVSGTVADPLLIFQNALKANASSLILCHNHPSGNVKPSEADKIITNRIVNGCKTLGLQLLDHVIITVDEYYSFADNALI